MNHILTALAAVTGLRTLTGKCIMVPKKVTIQIEMKNRTALPTKHITTFLAQTCWQTALITAGCPRVFIIVITTSTFLMKSAKTV